MTVEKSSELNASTRAWQRMLSGRRLHLLDPSPLDLDLADLVTGISRVNRWCGQTRGQIGFNVAQHSCVVEDVLTQMVWPGAPWALRRPAASSRPSWWWRR